jgi:hypothetical protein
MRCLVIGGFFGLQLACKIPENPRAQRHNLSLYFFVLRVRAVYGREYWKCKIPLHKVQKPFQVFPTQLWLFRAAYIFFGEKWTLPI